MPSHEDQVTNPLYWNWVKGGLGLKYLTEGLESFVDDTIRTVRTDFLDDIRRSTPGIQEVQCTECTTANVLPCPTPGMCNIRKRGKISMCSYHDKTDQMNTSRPCPNSICDKIRLKIHTLHRYKDPSWKNTNAHNWCSNHFEIGKCFLPKSGYEDKTATSQTDSSGILNMAINCLSIQRRLDFYINPPNDILSKLVNTRNSIFHSVSCTLTEEQLDSYIDDMVTLLKDKKTLLADLRAQTAVLKLTQLKQGPFHISPKDELEVRNVALRAVEEKKNSAIQEIQDKQEEVIDLIKEAHEVKSTKMSEEITAHTETMASQCDALESSIQTLKSTQESQEENIKKHELRLKAIEQTFSQLKTSQDLTEVNFTILLKDFSDFKDVMKGANTMEQQHKDRIEYLKMYFGRKQELQTKLCEMYKSHVESIPLSPVLDGLDVSVDDLFVELVICEDNIHGPRSAEKTFKENTQDSYKNKVKGYRDIIIRKVNECKNKTEHECNSECEKIERECKCKNMYVIGDAGMGKTTWCMKMVRTWVDAISTVDEATDGQGKLSDENIMSEIDILFFVSLRHAVNDGAIIDMVTHQLFEEFPEMDSIAKYVLRRESQNCLIILDGLDEWRPPMDFKPRSSLQHPGLPGRQDLCGCPILTTTRPWKLDKVRLSKPEIDRAVKIQGLKNHHSLIAKIICKLKDTDVYEGNLENRGKRDFVLAFEAAFKTSLGCDDDVHSSRNASYSFYRIPLILVFMVCMWYDRGKLEKTWAANFTGLIEFLIRIAERPSDERRPGRLSIKDNLPEFKAKWSLSSRYLPESLRKIKRLTNYSELILKLSKLAFGSLFTDSKISTLVFTEESLGKEFSTDELDVALKIGLISQSKVVGKTLTRLTSMSFLHKNIQEFFAALFLVWKTETDNKTALNKYISYCRTTKDIKEMENILLFVFGLCARTASEMSRHVADVTQYDLEDVLDLKTKCFLEMQAAHGSSYPSMKCPIFTSLHSIGPHVPVFLSDMTQLQELTLNNVNVLVQQHDTLDLSQLRELKTIHLLDINWSCIVGLDGSKLQNILMVKCCSIEINTGSNCRVAKETISKENSDTAFKIKDISLIDCRDCKLAIEGKMSTIDNVSFKLCRSCQFTINGTIITRTSQRSKIHSLAIDDSRTLILDINNEVEVKGVKIMDSQCIFTDTASINNLIQQLPRIKQINIDIKHSLIDDYSSFVLPNEVEDIAIPITWIEKKRHLSKLGKLIDLPRSNIVHLRLHGFRSRTMFDNLTEILPTLTKLKSFELDGTVTTKLLNTLTKICIERLGIRVCDGFDEVSQYLPRIENLQYLKLTVIHRLNYQHLSNMLLRMPQVKTLSINVNCDTFGINNKNAEPVQYNDKNIKELQLKEFSIDFEVGLSADKLPKPIVNYLKHCCHLKDLSCQIDVFEQFVSETELQPMLTQVETFKSKDEALCNVSWGAISIMSNVRHVDLRHMIVDNFKQLCGVIFNLEQLETLKLEYRGSSSSDSSISRQFVDSLPVTHQPITLDISGCRMEYDVEQYLRSRQWLQSVERTVTYENNGMRSTNVDKVHNIKIVLWKKIK